MAVECYYGMIDDSLTESPPIKAIVAPLMTSMPQQQPYPGNACQTLIPYSTLCLIMPCFMCTQVTAQEGIALQRCMCWTCMYV